MIKTFKNLEEMESYYNYKTDMYEFMNYLIDDRKVQSAGRSRKASTLHSFFD